VSSKGLHLAITNVLGLIRVFLKSRKGPSYPGTLKRGWCALLVSDGFDMTLPGL